MVQREGKQKTKNVRGNYTRLTVKMKTQLPKASAEILLDWDEFGLSAGWARGLNWSPQRCPRKAAGAWSGFPSEGTSTGAGWFVPPLVAKPRIEEGLGWVWI